MTTIEHDAARIYETLRGGGLALVPLDVGYGLVAMEEPAVARIYELKGRPLSKPCVTVANARILDAVALPIDGEIRDWIDQMTRVSPLAVVAHLDPASRLLGSLPPYVRTQATHDGTIALFHSAGAVVQRLAELALADGRLVVGSSANLSGTGNHIALAEVPSSIRSAVDLVIDHGPARYGEEARGATTILSLTTGTFQRKGVSFAMIERAWLARFPHNPVVRAPVPEAPAAG